MRRWWAGVRAAGRIAWRDAVRAKGRTALVAVMIGLPILVGSGGAVLLQSTVATDARELDWQLGGDGQARIEEYVGPGVEQSPRADRWTWDGEGAHGDPPELTEYEAALTRVLPHDDDLVRVLSGTARVSTADRAPNQELPIVERPAGPALDSLWPLVEGAWPVGPGQVALDEHWAGRLQVAVGDTVTVTPEGAEPVDAVVTGIAAEGPPQHRVGVFTAPGGVLEPPAALAEEYGNGNAYRWYVVGPEPVTWEHVQQINALGSTVLSRAVVLDPPADPLGGSAPMDATSISIAGVVAALALLEAILLIGPAFAVGARRAERQLALIGANGGERRTLRHVVLFGGVVTGFGASVIALAAGVGIAVGVRWVVGMRDPYVFPDLRIPPVIAAFVLLGTLIATAAAWVPARRASRIDVVAALSGRRRETAAKHRMTVLGVLLFAAGAVATFVGATTSELMVLIGGVLALEVGLIAASGGLITLVGRVAPRLGVAGRIAVRDAVRQRSRTAPAVAAVIAAIAGVIAGAVYTESDVQHRIAQYGPLAGEGVVAAALPNHGPLADLPAGNLTGEQATEAAAELEALRAQQYELAVETVRAGLPVTDVVPVSVAVARSEPSSAPATTASIGLDVPEEGICPLWRGGELSAAERKAASTDPRCAESPGGQVLWLAPMTWSQVIVDDGTAMEALRLPGSDEAAAALRAGNVVVTSEHHLWPDGTALLTVETWDDGATEPRDRREVALPAVVVDLPSPQQYGPLLPPDVLEELGLTTTVAGLVAPTSRTPTQAEEDAVRKVFDGAAVGPATYLYVERGPHETQQVLILLLLVGAALVVGLGATGISVALAAVESRPDLATLGAVGAAPGVRRRVAAAQAGVIAVIGGTLGVVTGLMLGRALVLAQKHAREVVDFDWVVVTPWPAVAAVAIGVPLLAMAGGYLLTRSRLPMVRRIAA